MKKLVLLSFLLFISNINAMTRDKKEEEYKKFCEWVQLVKEFDINLDKPRTIGLPYSSTPGENVNVSVYGRPLILSAGFGDKSYENTRLLLNKMANPNEKGEWGTTAIHEAMTTYAFETIKLLFERNANLHALTDDNETALHRICSPAMDTLKVEKEEKRIRIVSWLLNAQVDPNVQLKSTGNTCLHQLIAYPYKGWVDVEKEMSEDQVAHFHENKRKLLAQRKKLIDLFLVNNGKLSIKNNGGKTPLELASELNVHEELKKECIALAQYAQEQDCEGFHLVSESQTNPSEPKKLFASAATPYQG